MEWPFNDHKGKLHALKIQSPQLIEVDKGLWVRVVKSGGEWRRSGMGCDCVMQGGFSTSGKNSLKRVESVNQTMQQACEILLTSAL